MNDLAKNKRKNIYKKKLILKNKNGFKVHILFQNSLIYFNFLIKIKQFL